MTGPNLEQAIAAAVAERLGELLPRLVEDARALASEELLSPREIRRRLDTSAATVDRLIKDGEIPGEVRVADTTLRRWRRAAFDAWVREGCPSREERKEVGRRSA